MSLRKLLTNVADLQTASVINIWGRAENAWSTITSIQCRFTNPNTSKTLIADGGEVSRVDAVVFAEMSLLPLIEGVKLPVRLVTKDLGWEGTYELHEPPRVYAATKRVSHVELDVVRVEK